jgi:hypothetical protein
LKIENIAFRGVIHKLQQGVLYRQYVAHFHGTSIDTYQNMQPLQHPFLRNLQFFKQHYLQVFSLNFTEICECGKEG